MESVEKKSLYVVHALCKVRRVSLSIHVQADYICWMEIQLLWFIDKVTFTFADGVGMITELVWFWACVKMDTFFPVALQP